MKVWITVFSGLMMLAMTGCGGSGKYCSDWVACVGGNDKDEQACMEAYDADEKTASIYGCDDQWSKYAQCRLDNSSCVELRNGNMSYTTRDSTTNEDACAAESSNLNACEDGASTVNG